MNLDYIKEPGKTIFKLILFWFLFIEGKMLVIALIYIKFKMLKGFLIAWQHKKTN